MRWRYMKSLPYVSSTLLYKDILYMVRDGGILTSLNPETGEVLKQGRLEGAIDPYYASPVAADDKVVVASQTGKVTVLKAGAEWDILSVNDLGEECYATPAIANNRLYVRTRGSLYCFAHSTVKR
jgi:outer membrane protein assembly factor BamB